MDLILDIGPKNLEKVLYFASYIVLDRNGTRYCIQSRFLLKKNTEKLYDQYGNIPW